MTKRSPFKYFKTSPETIRLVVLFYVRFPLSLGNVEDLLITQPDVCKSGLVGIIHPGGSW